MARSKGHGSPPGMRVALLSALLFGMTPPLAKVLLEHASAVLLAGLLYAGSGVGLTLLRLARDRRWQAVGLAGGEGGWLAAAILCGGVIAPALLMLGLARLDAATASLLLNLEVVFTALIAWLAFREATSRRVVLGLLAIFLGGAAMALPSRWASSSGGVGLIVAACFCWALDNNLTRRIAGADALALAAIKGLAAGAVNIALALLLAGAVLPSAGRIGAALALGFVGYGVSLALYIVALRELGAARASAYFGTAPFIGAAIALAVFARPAGAGFWVAAALMALGVWLHASEHHEHAHVHPSLTHSHAHAHDDRHGHRHEHDFEWDGREPHVHEHRHGELEHSHAHFPDIHHRHHHD
jgi:drug/metabolite transporter (DMT)-like permease